MPPTSLTSWSSPAARVPVAGALLAHLRRSRNWRQRRGGGVQHKRCLRRLSSSISPVTQAYVNQGFS